MTKTEVFAFNSGVRATYIPDAFGDVRERIDFSFEGVVYYSLKHTRAQKEDTWTLERYAQGSKHCQTTMATELSRLFPAEYIWFLPVGLTDPDYCPWIEGYLVNRFIDWMENNLRPLKVGGITRA